MQKMDAGIKNHLCQYVSGEAKGQTYFRRNRRNFPGDKSHKHDGKDRDAECRVDLLHKGIKAVT
ncbi:hypothetical protein D3C71_2101300 [compost metagenome]